MARSRKRRFAKNHQSSWLYGRHAVLAMLGGTHWRADEIFVADEALLEGVAVPDDIQITPASDDRIAELTKTEEHQGLAARMPAYPYLSVDDLLSARPSAVLILDRIQYPMNFGTMLRSAEVFGVTSIIVGDSGQSDVTAAVARMSAGAVFHARIAQTDDLLVAVQQMQAGDYQVLATTPVMGQPCDQVDLTARCGVIIGRESDGVAAELIDACNERVLIPQSGQTQSLNAAASAAILLYEMSRQRRFAGA